MRYLYERDDDEIRRSLIALVTGYENWIEARRREALQIEDRFRAAADRHLDEAGEAARRMRDGIDLLAEDATALRAFRLMNRAMGDQRARQDWIRSGSGGAPSEGAAQSWHAFQLAFILLNLRGLTVPDHPDRRLADLLWFPTGGGKTEAYLGLIAYVVLLRRLRSPEDSGVSVIMRYTLRLLTLQQFERAATLICALEVARCTEKDLEDVRPFSIGLWVGQKVTPNTSDRRSILNSCVGAGAEGRQSLNSHVVPGAARYSVSTSTTS